MAFGTPRRRRGSLLDPSIIVMVIFLLLVVSFLGYFAIGEFSTALEDSDVAGNKSVEFVQGAENAILLMDGGLVFLMAANFLASAYFAFRIKSNPLYFVLSLVSLSLLVFLTAELSNVFWMFIQVPIISGIANQFPQSVLMVRYLPHIAFSFAILVIIAMYAKLKNRNTTTGR